MSCVSTRVVAVLVCVAAATSNAAAPSFTRADDRTHGRAAAPAASDEAADTFARKVFDAGKAAYEIGNYAEALRYFQQAYELSSRPELLYHVGLAADHLQQEETALQAFAMYLERVPNAPNRTDVEQRLVTLMELIADKRDATEAEADSAPPVAPSPAEVALAAQPAASTASRTDAAPARDEGSTPIWKRWWFWAGAGAVVAAVVVTSVVASSGGETTTGEPFSGSNGMVIQTLQRSGR
jgi:tetratricopeptide (TPR) repeat protein